MEERNRTPWRITRLFMLLCWLVWILTFFIVVTLFQAVLQVHVVAQVAQAVDRGFISFSRDFIQFVPLDSTSEKVDRMMDEMMLRYYLEMRYSILPDEQEMVRRWGPNGVVSYLSTSSVYKDFHDPEIYLPKISDVPPRAIDITRISREGNKYTVDMDIYEYSSMKKWVKQSKYLTVRYAYVSSRSYLGGAFSNPKGFVVTYIDDRKTSIR